MTQPVDVDAARLIAVDWGSTGLRIFLLGDNGRLLATRVSSSGASVTNGASAYAETLQQLAGDWMQRPVPPLPVIVCGMAGSKHGWQEVPYVATPADAGQLAHNLGLIKQPSVHIVPGLIVESLTGPPDVMRGEETQLIGALNLHPEFWQQSCIVLPGTHSKWTQINDDKITRFATHMTGELFAVLRDHSVLGRLLSEPAGTAMGPGFLQGVNAARNSSQLGLTHQLFAVRTLGLTLKLQGRELADYLSGLLIGHECLAGLAWRHAAGLGSAPLVLVGEPDLCQRYEQALLCFEARVATVLPNTAPAGLWSLARAARLV